MTFFAGKDVAAALGYSNTSKAIQLHVDEEDKGILPIRETAYETRAVFINGRLHPHQEHAHGHTPERGRGDADRRVMQSCHTVEFMKFISRG